MNKKIEVISPSLRNQGARKYPKDHKGVRLFERNNQQYNQNGNQNEEDNCNDYNDYDPSVSMLSYAVRNTQNEPLIKSRIKDISINMGNANKNNSFVEQSKRHQHLKTQTQIEIEAFQLHLNHNPKLTTKRGSIKNNSGIVQNQNENSHKLTFARVISNQNKKKQSKQQTNQSKIQVNNKNQSNKLVNRNDNGNGNENIHSKSKILAAGSSNQSSMKNHNKNRQNRQKQNMRNNSNNHINQINSKQQAILDYKNSSVSFSKGKQKDKQKQNKITVKNLSKQPQLLSSSSLLKVYNKKSQKQLQQSQFHYLKKRVVYNGKTNQNQNQKGHKLISSSTNLNKSNKMSKTLPIGQEQIKKASKISNLKNISKKTTSMNKSQQKLNKLKQTCQNDKNDKKIQLKLNNNNNKSISASSLSVKSKLNLSLSRKHFEEELKLSIINNTNNSHSNSRLKININKSQFQSGSSAQSSAQNKVSVNVNHSPLFINRQNTNFIRLTSQNCKQKGSQYPKNDNDVDVSSHIDLSSMDIIKQFTVCQDYYEPYEKQQQQQLELELQSKVEPKLSFFYYDKKNVHIRIIQNVKDQQTPKNKIHVIKSKQSPLRSMKKKIQQQQQQKQQQKLVTIQKFKILSQIPSFCPYIKKQKAVFKPLNFLCCLSTIQKRFLHQNDLIKRQLIQSTILRQSIKFPNLIQLYHVFQDQSKIYLMEEYCYYSEQKINFNSRSEQISEKEACFIFKQVLDSCKYLHSQQIIHRALKLQELKVSEFEVCKISNFQWIAKMQKNKNRQTFCGQIELASPQVLANMNYDESIDIWQLGILLYKLLTGNKHPFCQSSTNDHQLKQTQPQYLQQIENTQIMAVNQSTMKNIQMIRIKFSTKLTNQAIDLLGQIFEQKQKRISLQKIFNHPLLHKYDYDFSVSKQIWNFCK